jgi:anti-sigma B factor antagonist
MELHFSDLENGISCIKLIGTLDTQGVDAIEIKFAGYSSGDHARVLVDLSEVEFLASIGIRMLVTTAKAVVNRGGKLVLLNPNENVMNVLQMTGVPDILPVHRERNAAIAGLSLN